MDDYKHPQTPLRMKPELEPTEIKKFIDAIEGLTVKFVALLLAIGGLRKREILSLKATGIDTRLRIIIPSCHSGETKHSVITFYNSEAEACLNEYLAQIELLKRKIVRSWIRILLKV
jgi:integrase